MSTPVNFESLNFGNVGRDAMNFNFPRESYLVNFESDLPSLNAVSLALAPSKKQYLGIIEIRDDTAFMYQKHFEEKSYENFVQPPQINFEKSRSRRMDKPAHSNDFIDPQHYFTNPRASKSPGATRVTYENIQIQNSSRKH